MFNYLYPTSTGDVSPVISDVKPVCGFRWGEGDNGKKFIWGPLIVALGAQIHGKDPLASTSGKKVYILRRGDETSPQAKYRKPFSRSPCGGRGFSGLFTSHVLCDHPKHSKLMGMGHLRPRGIWPNYVSSQTTFTSVISTQRNHWLQASVLSSRPRWIFWRSWQQKHVIISWAHFCSQDSLFRVRGGIMGDDKLSTKL